MPTAKIQLKGYPYQNIDGVELTAQPERLVDAYVDEAGTYVKRPGLLEFADSGTAAAIDGMYYWEEKDLAIVVSNQNIYKLTEAGVITSVTNDQLTGLNRPTFAEVVDGDNSHHLAMADGGNMIHWDGAGTTTQMADADAPTTVTHVAFIDGYLLANNGDNKFWWSDTYDFDAWTATSFATAETDNDNIDAITVQNREVTLYGLRSIENWYSTGDSAVFTRKLGAEVEDGIIAPYSLQKLQKGQIWLNRERRVVIMQGRTPTVISTPFDKVFSNFSTVTDAIGDILQVDGRGFYLLTFPTEGRTFVYDYQMNGWAEWAYWDTNTAAYLQYEASSVLYVPQWGKYLIGDRVDGKIYTTAASLYDDNGDTIRMLLRTGHVDHGSYRRKRSNLLTLRFKRGVATGSETTPEVSIRWRDDGGAWGNASLQSLGLGQTGENEFFVTLKRNGIYRTRQYEIVQTDNVEFRFIDMEEEFDWMTS